RRARAALEDAGQQVETCESVYGQSAAEVQSAERSADETRAALLAATTTLSALQQARDHAAAARDRVAAERERLDAELRDLHAEAARGTGEHTSALDALRAAGGALEAAVPARAPGESPRAGERTSRDTAESALETLRHEHAAVAAR